MANDILGSELNIDGLIEAADKAQKAMDKVADSAEGAGKKISDVFKSISTQGIDYTLQKLYDLKATYESISKVEVKDAGLKEIATNAKTALDEVNKLIEGLSKAYGAKAPTSTTAQQKAEENRYNEWLRQKHEEEQIHKQIEDRKTQATRSAIAEQNQAYADANAKKQSIARDNDNVKINSEVARKAYEEQLRMYENLFAQAEKKRPDLIDVAKTRTDINAIDSQLDKLMDRINRLNNEMQLFKSMESGKTLKTENYAHIGKVSDELNKLMAQYEALDKLKTAMSSKSGFEQAIADLSGVSLQAQRSKQALDDLAQSYRTGTSAFHQQMKTPEFALDFSKNAKSIEEERQAIQLLKQARESLDKTTPDGKKKVQELTDAIANHEKNLKRATQSTQEYNDAQRKLASKRLEHIYSVSPNLALNYSKQAKSINEQILAIKRLKSARDNLNRGNFASEEAYRKKVQELNNEIKRQQTEVDKLTNKNKNLSNSHRSLMDTAGQLTRKLALLFSVSAIQGYFNKLVSIRGEFELQAKSLEVLLQNKDEANKLWNQTVQLAVKSPFTVKELVTYTKQLAAYRIESDKLYETNKMLADVSAGLGVDMRRLILAYGQVKAANFLRGTELRQFSEAGVNMLDELAKRFTALEGRVVSVGDVFERVSKRMVSFADVEAVFKTLTSEGGTFYMMQEKQAETLRGMVSNLKDQIDLMLNDVGMRNEGFLKGLVSLTVTLIKNWRDIVPLINMVSGILITRFLQKGMVGILRMTKGVVLLLNQWRIALRGATVEATAMGTTLSKVTKANAWIALIGLVVSLGYAIYDATTSASKLQEELGRIDTDLTQRLEDSISGYISLAKTATDANKSMEEQKEAVAKLNSAYDDILPQYMLTHDYLQQLNGDYKEVTDAIRLYYETQAIEQKKAKIKDKYSEDINTDTVDLISDIKNQIKDSDLEQDLKDYLLASVSGAVHATLRDVEQGEIASDTKAITEAIFSAMAQGTGLSSDALIKALGGNVKKVYGDSFLELEEAILFKNSFIGKNISELATSFRDLNRELEGLEGLPDLENKIPLADKEGYEKTKEAYDLMNGLMNEYVNFVNKYVGKENVAWELLTPTINTENLEKLKALYPQLVPILQEFYTQLQRAANGQVQFAQSLPLIKATAIESFGAIVNNANTASNAIRDFGKVGITAGHDFSRIWADTDITNLTNPMQKALTQGNTAVKNFVEKANNDVNKLQFNKVGTEIFNAMKQISQTQGVDLDVFAKIIPSANQSLDEYKRKVKEYLETLQEVQKTVNSKIITESFRAETLAGVNMDSVEELDATTKAVKMLAEMIGVLFKSISGRGRKNDPAKDFANVLQEMFREYEKMNDKFSKEESKNRIARYFKETFEEASRQVKGFKLQLEDFDFTTFDGVINALSSLKKIAKDSKTQLAIQREIDKLETERDTTAIEKSIELRNKEIDQLFEMYDLYKELDELDFPKELAKKMFGIDATNLNELRSELEKNKYRFVGEEGEKEYQKYLDKITELENKEQIERLKNYSKYLTKAMDERVKIKLEELRQIREIEELKGVDDATKRSMEEGVKKETQKKITKQDWEDFKGSEVYIEMFRDLDNISDSAINAMLSRLEQLKDSLKNNLDPSDLKEIVSAIDKMQDELEERENPFTSLISNAKEYFDFLKEKPEIEKKFQESIAKESELDAKVKAQKDIVAQAKSELEIAQKADVLDRHKIGNLKLILKQEKETLKTIADQLLAQQKITKEQYDQLVNGQKAGVGLAKNLGAIGEYFNEFGSGITSIATSLESVFGGMSDSMRDTIESMVEISNGIENTLSGIGRAIANPADIGGYVQAVSGLASTIGSIFNIGDKEKERQIQREIDRVETLKDAYEDLNRIIEKGYSLDKYRKAGEQAMNMYDQIAAYERMIQKEKDKKDIDWDRIEEWRDDMRELRNEIEDLFDNLKIELIGDFKDYGQQLGDAFVEALKSGEDALDAWGKAVNDIVNDIMLKLLVQKFVEPEIAKLIDEYYAEIMPKTNLAESAADAQTKVEEARLKREELRKRYKEAKVAGESEKYLKALSDEYDYWGAQGRYYQELARHAEEYAKNAMGEVPTISQAATQAFRDGMANLSQSFNSIFPDWLRDEMALSESSLGGLQEGIQGVTEETAQIIEAYLNSIRFYIAQDNQNLADLRNFFIGSGEDANPILSQLKMQTELIRAIKDMFSSVIYSGGHPTYGGAFLKVSL